MLEGDKIDYKSNTNKIPTLEVPPDLTQLQREERFAVQQRGVVSASELSNRPAAAATSGSGATAAAGTAAGSNVLPEFKNARIERAGTQRWLSVDLPADKVYPIVREFWGNAGFTLKVDSPDTGILETEWNENRANVPKDGVRRLLGTVLDGFYDSGTRDKYRTRLERRSDGGTDIFLTHRGMQEVLVGNQKDQTRWDVRPADPELENEFMRRLLMRFGLQDTKAQAMVAQGAAATGTAAPAAAPRARLVQEGNASVLQMDEAFDRAWRSVGLALDRLGYTVVDRDRAQGTYFVRTVDPNKDIKEQGFFSRLFGSSRPVDAEDFRLLVKSQADKTQVVVQGKDGAAVTGEAGNRILRLLADELK
jgi:outer membrane protein assembly factor BamC